MTNIALSLNLHKNVPDTSNLIIARDDDRARGVIFSLSDSTSKFLTVTERRYFCLALVALYDVSRGRIKIGECRTRCIKWRSLKRERERAENVRCVSGTESTEQPLPSLRFAAQVVPLIPFTNFTFTATVVQRRSRVLHLKCASHEEPKCQARYISPRSLYER